MNESKPRFRFSVYRSDVHAGESMYVAEARYHSIADVLAYAYQPEEKYLVLIHKPRRWMSKEEFAAWASEQTLQ
jgi:hypothetical protein